MAVERSPFSKTAGVRPKGYGFDDEGNPVYVKADGTIMPLSVGKAKGKTTFAEEKNRLETKTTKIVTGLASNPALSFVQQAQARSAALAIAGGGSGSVDNKGALGNLLKAVASVPAKAASGAFKVYDTLVSPFQQVGQSAVKELVDVMKGEGASVDDFLRQARTKNFSAAEAAGVKNKFVKGLTNFALDTVFDPTTYLTLGASAASKATRFALANDVYLLSKKYPELAGLVSNVARYGATVIPKHIREAEGIAAGIKYMGKEIPHSSGLAKAWRYTLAPVRAKIGDVVAGTTAGKVLLQKTTAESLKDLTLAGLGRAATQNVANPKFVQGFMELSASRWSKAVGTQTLKNAQSKMAEAVALAESKGETKETLAMVYKAIENPSLDATLNPAQKELADTYRVWRDELYNKTAEMRRKLSDDYGIAVREMGYIEDHIFHKITPEAKAWTLGREGTTKSGYRSIDLTERDILETGGTMAYRKLRGPVIDETGKIVRQSKFLGRDVTDASIDGLNKISMEELGFKWFSDDLGDIAQGYAESMARAQARVAYVDRAMQYGPDAILPLIGRVVKDETLIEDLGIAGRILAKQQKNMRARVRRQIGLAGTKEGVAVEAATMADFLDSVLQGNMLARGTADAVHDEALADLTIVLDTLERARQRSLTLDLDAKGEFDDLWGGLLREAEAMRDAIVRGEGDRFMALKELRTEYVRLYGGDADAEKLQGKTAEWFAERIKRRMNGGKSETAEQARLLKRQEFLRSSLDEIPPTAEFDATRQRIVAELDAVDQQLEGVRTLEGVRESASYADSGVIWGSVPAEGDEIAPFQMWTTKPIDDEFGTFGRMPDSLMGHAIPEEDLVDFRNAERMADLVSEDTLADTVNRVWREAGIEDPTWASIVDEAFATGEVPETLSIVSPAKADMLQGFLDFKRMVDDAVNQGVDLTDFEIDSFFGWFREASQAVAAEYSLDNSDNVANTMLMNLLRGTVGDAVEGGYRGALVPMRTIFPEMDDIGGEWAVLLPSDTPTPIVGGGITDEWQTVADNPLAQSLLEGSQESLELDLMAKGDALRTEGLDLQALQESRDALEKELSDLSAPNPVDDAVNRARAAETVRFQGKDIPVAKARKELAKMDAVLARETANIDRQVARQIEEEFGSQAALEAQRLTLEERLPILLDNVRAMKNWDSTMGSRIRNEVDAIRLLLTRKPAKGSTAASNAAWVKQVETALANSELLDFDPVLKDAYDRVISLVHSSEIELAKIDNEIADNALKLSKAEAGEIGRLVYDKAIAGWEELEGMGVQVPAEVAEKWKPNLNKLRDTAEAEKMWSYIDKLQNYWKRYVTASVGFFMRNGLSGTFMNYADGVGLDEMSTGLKWAFIQAESKGKTKAGKIYANWMERAGLTTPEQIAEADMVEKIVAAAGRGVNGDFAIPSFGLDGAKGNIITRASNKYLGFFSRKNDLVENALRIPMALDSIRRGMSFDQAVARIQRVHFDYSDLSKLDESMKRFVPFWIWTSRNVPLQVSQMVSRPKAYVQYERLKREFPVNEELMVPSWIQKQGPLGVGLASVLTPDLPQTRLAENLKQIATPSGIIGQTNPLLRVPAELWMGRQVALDIPFGDKQTANGVEKAVAKVLYNLTGTQWADIDPKTGKVMIAPQATYVIENALPILAQAYRLSGGRLGGKESLNERWVGNVLNWFGVPLRQIGETQQRGEAIRRNFQLADLEKQLKDIIEKNRP